MTSGTLNYYYPFKNNFPKEVFKRNVLGLPRGQRECFRDREVRKVTTWSNYNVRKLVKLPFDFEKTLL